MSTYFGQLPPQFNNKYVNSKLVNKYQQFVNTNIPFSNNTLLMSNPGFAGVTNDPKFFERINMAKMEQSRKINNIKDLGIDNKQLINYIICPIKVEKRNKNDLDNDYNTKKDTYITKFTNNSDNLDNLDNIPKLLQEWYKGRKNIPYKNILKKENYNKEFTKKEDLIVHKVTQLDKDKLILEEEISQLEKMIEKHDGDLKMIYSLSEETTHKEKFKYNNYYKNRIKYDPKNYTDLKKFYKKEQKKINKETQRIDEMLELLLVDDQISKEELEELKKPLNNDDNDNDNDIEKDNDNDIEKDTEIIYDKSEKELEKRLESKLRKELGDKEFDKIIKHCECDENEDIIDDTKTEPEPIKKCIKIKNHNHNHNNDHDMENLEGSKEHKKIKIIRKSEIKNEIGKISNDDIEKYKNRKKII